MSNSPDESDSSSYEDTDFGGRYDNSQQQDDDFEFDEPNNTLNSSVSSGIEADVKGTATKVPSTTVSSNIRKNTSENPSTSEPKSAGTIVKNQPFDEVVEASDGESEEGIPSPQPNSPSKIQGENTLSGDDDLDGDDDDEDDDEEDDEGEGGERIGEYDPTQYMNLGVSREVQELFNFITAYKPPVTELETKLKPFIPEYIAAVGDLDPFLKIPRPDGVDDFLGLKVLDEPATKQSDPSVVTLSLSYLSRDVKSRPVQVNSVENADKNKKKVLKWIDDIGELHKTKPPPTVTYSRPMPDINRLMDAWPDAYEELLHSMELPGPEIDLELDDYVKIICTLLDIPVNGNLIESLHVLFTLYLEFKRNQHFSQQLQL